MQQTYQPHTSDEFEMDSRHKLLANNNSLGTESENSAMNLEQLPPKSSLNSDLTAPDKPSNLNQGGSDTDDQSKQRPINANSSIKTKSNRQSKKLNDRNVNENLEKRNLPSNYTGVFDASILMYEENMNDSDSLMARNDLDATKPSLATKINTKSDKLGVFQVVNNIDATTRGGMSTTYNQQIADDSLSTLSDKKKKVIVRIVTIFSVIFFLICFAMIAFTLRMSEKIDAQIRKGYSGSNFNAFATTKINHFISNVSNSSFQSIGSNQKSTDTKSSLLLKRALSSNMIKNIDDSYYGQEIIMIPKLKHRNLVEKSNLWLLHTSRKLASRSKFN